MNPFMLACILIYNENRAHRLLSFNKVQPVMTSSKMYTVLIFNSAGFYYNIVGVGNWANDRLKM